MPEGAPMPSPPWEYPPDPDEIPADPEDFLYRDRCVATLPLLTMDFDAKTGEVLAEGTEKYFAFGEIAGVKPRARTCVPMKNTPLDNLTGYFADPNLAFGLFMPMSDYSDPEQLRIPHDYTTGTNLYKGFEDATRRAYRMIGGTSYCVQQLKPNFSFTDGGRSKTDLINIATFLRAQAENCYDQYVVRRSPKPWHFFEPRGSAMVEYPGSYKDIIGQYCQPLVSGTDALAIYRKEMPHRDAGYSKVVHSTDFRINENEYYYSTYVRQAWQKALEYGTSSQLHNYYSMENSIPVPTSFHDFSVNLPCLKQYPDVIFKDADDDDDGPPSPMPSPSSTPSPSPAPSPDPCADFYTSSHSDSGVGTYNSGGGRSDDDMTTCPVGSTFCGPSGGGTHSPGGKSFNYDTLSRNLQQQQDINDALRLVDSALASNANQTVANPGPTECPGYRFIIPKTTQGKPAGTSDKYCPNVEKINDVTGPFSPRDRVASIGFSSDPYLVPVMQVGGGKTVSYAGTDRMYSWVTSQKVRVGPSCQPKQGYTNFDDYDDKQIVDDPEVYCGVVPVDIMEFRADDFHACIMQRINKNLNTWIEWEESDDPNKGALKIPCSTKYDEYDDPNECRAALSIQQCCSIITKPVVPVNFLKIKTADNVNKVMQEKGLSPLIEDYMKPIAGSFLTSVQANKTIHKVLKDNGAPIYNEPSDYRFRPTVSEFYDSDGMFMGNHLPGMRRWDTGAYAYMPRHGGSNTNTLHTYDIIVGAGREERDKYEAQVAKQRAQAAGKPDYEVEWVGEPMEREAGNYGNWTELVAQQAMSMRYQNLMCLPQYEKSFKPFDGDNFVYSKAGTDYKNRDSESRPWPLPWQGYSTDTFINQGSGMPFLNNPMRMGIGKGLDNVERGDIIVLNIGGFPRSYYVLEKSTHPNNANATKPDYLNVVSWNQGLHKTAQDITATGIGIGQISLLYKKDIKDPVFMWNLSYFKQRAIDKENDDQPVCTDPNYAKCVLSEDDWENGIIYRPYYNMDMFGPGDKANKCPLPMMADTYDAKWDEKDTMKIPAGMDPILHNLTYRYPSNNFAYCVNAGYAPPFRWRAERGFGHGFTGAGTGATTFLSLCPPGNQTIPENGGDSKDSWGLCPSVLLSNYGYPDKD